MGRLRKVLLILSIVAALFALLAVGLMLGAGFVFDSKIDSALIRLEQRVPGLKLDYQETVSSLTSRSGRLDWQLQLPAQNPLGLPYISGSTDLSVNFGLLGARAAFVNIPGSGNLDEFLARLNLQPIGYSGALKLSLLPPRAEGAVKSSAFTLPFAYGSCEVGENSVYIAASSADDIDAEINAAGLKCRGSEIYAGKESFNAQLLGLRLTLSPRYDRTAGRLYADSISLSLERLLVDVSTLFAIGFEPDSPVKDVSLRDLLNFDAISASFAFKEKDEAGRAYLDFAASGNYAFAFPYIRQGKVQPLYRLDKLKLTGQAGKLDAKGVFRALSALSEPEGFRQLLTAFSPHQEFKLHEFSFVHQGQQSRASGSSSADFDFDRLKLNAVQADFKLAGGSTFVRSFAGGQYQEALNELTTQGLVDFDGSSYSTRLTIHNQEISLNGRPLLLKNDTEETFSE